MSSELDEIHAAYEQLQAAKAAFEQTSSLLREGHGDFARLARLLGELNLAQHRFSDAAAKIVKGGEQPSEA